MAGTTPATATAPAPTGAAPAATGTTPPPAGGTTPAAGAPPPPTADRATTGPGAGATLLGDAAKGAEGKDGAGKTTQAIEPYKLTLPEGSLLEAADAEKIAAKMRERGFSKEQAQTFLDEHSAGVKAYADSALAKFQAQQQEWVKTLQADPQVGGAKLSEANELATRAAVKFGGQEFLDMLVQSGYARHPMVFRFLYNLGRASANDRAGTVMPAGTTPAKRSLEDMYRQGAKGEEGA